MTAAILVLQILIDWKPCMDHYEWLDRLSEYIEPGKSLVEPVSEQSAGGRPRSFEVAIILIRQRSRGIKIRLPLFNTSQLLFDDKKQLTNLVARWQLPKLVSVCRQEIAFVHSKCGSCVRSSSETTAQTWSKRFWLNMTPVSEKCFVLASAWLIHMRDDPGSGLVQHHVVQRSLSWLTCSDWRSWGWWSNVRVGMKAKLQRLQGWRACRARVEGQENSRGITRLARAL